MIKLHAVQASALQCCATKFKNAFSSFTEKIYIPAYNGLNFANICTKKLSAKKKEKKNSSHTCCLIKRLTAKSTIDISILYFPKLIILN